MSHETPTLDNRPIRQPESGQDTLSYRIQAVGTAYDAGVWPTQAINDGIVRVTVNDLIAALITLGESRCAPDQVLNLLFFYRSAVRIETAMHTHSLWGATKGPQV